MAPEPGDLGILRYGDARLRQVCHLANGETDLPALADALWRLMLRHGGVGLSAPQLGDLRRLIVVKDMRRPRSPARLVLVNPRLSEPSPETSSYEEGCLSFPGLYIRLIRPRAVTVTFEDLAGQERRIAMDGLLARVVQHEVDHLDGVLFIDHLSPWRRRRELLRWRLLRLGRS
jgi:peptide deformylase